MNCEELGINISSNNAEVLAKFYEEVLGLFVEYSYNGETIRLDGKRFTITINQSKEKGISPIEFTVFVNCFVEMKDKLIDKGCELYYDSAHPDCMKMEDPDGNVINFTKTNHR